MSAEGHFVGEIDVLLADDSRMRATVRARASWFETRRKGDAPHHEG